MENVKFPVIVEGSDWCGLGFDILGSELVSISDELINEDEGCYFSLLSGECEVIDEE